MKKILLSILILCFGLNVFSQSATSTQYSKDQFLLKNKKKKKIGFILLGAGAALLATGILIPKGEYTGFEIYPPGDTYENDNIKAAFSVGGLVSMLGSIPLFIASGRNKRRANAISLTDQKILFPYKNTMLSKSNPSLTLKIGL